jgi:phosphohistidine phosphatase SixA
VPTRRALLAAPLLAASPAGAGNFLATPAALSVLRAGGLNLYLRHGITDRSQVDTGRRGDRAGQRNLDARGRAQASALGQAFARLGIPVGRVFASEVFRAHDTATLMFGPARVEVLEALIADDYTPRDPRDDAAAMRSRLAQPPSAGNDVFVGHIVPFGMILGHGLSQAEFPEGAIGLLRPEGARFTALGIIPAEALIGAA